MGCDLPFDVSQSHEEDVVAGIWMRTSFRPVRSYIYIYRQM